MSKFTDLFNVGERYAAIRAQQLGTVPREAEPEPTTRVVEYKDAKAFARDANKLARDGWAVISTTETKSRSGAGRKAASVALPVVMLFPHARRIVVTYQRAERS